MQDDKGDGGAPGTAKPSRSSDFFVIVDGDQRICLVDLVAEKVQVLGMEEIKYAAIHLGLAKTSEDGKTVELDIHEVAVQLSGAFPRGGGEAHVAALKQIQAISDSLPSPESGVYDSGRISACISGEAPMVLIVGRGKR